MFHQIREAGEACPCCGRMHVAGPYTEHRVGRKKVFYPDPVRCECGHRLNYTRPIYERTITGYSWLVQSAPAEQQLATASTTAP